MSERVCATLFVPDRARSGQVGSTVVADTRLGRCPPTSNSRQSADSPTGPKTRGDAVLQVAATALLPPPGAERSPVVTLGPSLALGLDLLERALDEGDRPHDWPAVRRQLAPP